MHSYAIETTERERIFAFLAILSVLLSWLLNKILIITETSIPWWFDAPSVFGFFSLLILLFNYYLWKIIMIRKLLGITTPHLDGSWKGFIKTSFEKYQNEIQAELIITQSWLRIIIVFKTDSSESKSSSLSIVRQGQEYELIYSYDNYPDGGEAESLVPHKGFVLAKLNSSYNIIDGQYFTDPHRSKNLF